MSVGDTSRRYPQIPRGLYEQLLAVEPAVDFGLDYRPCRVKLTDGTVRDRVYVQEARPWVEIWGVWPDEDDYKTEIPISEVAEISSSPVRLPAPLAEKMYAAGESGMGYCVFTLVLADGRHIPRLTGNAVDFVTLPTGVVPDQVVDLLPGVGERSADSHSDDYAWCLYELPPVD